MKSLAGYMEKDISIFDDELTFEFPSINFNRYISTSHWEKIKNETNLLFLCITKRCNQDCPICFTADKRKKFLFDDMNLKEIDYVMKKIGHYKKIALFGGEPTVREDLPEIIKVIQKNKNIPILYTNGIKLANFSYVKMLGDLGIKKVYLTINGLNEYSAKKLDGDPKLVYTKLKALENLKKYGEIKVVLSSKIANHINDDQVEKLFNFAVRNNDFIKGIAYVRATNVSNTKYLIGRDTTISLGKIMKLIQNASNGVITPEYFSEFNNLRVNLYSLLKKIGASFPILTRSVYIKLLNGKIKPLISIKELKEINANLENGNLLSLLKYAYKYRAWFGLVRRIFKPATVEYETYKRNGMMVSIYAVDSHNILKHKLEFEQIEKRNNIIVKSQEELTT